MRSADPTRTAGDPALPAAETVSLCRSKAVFRRTLKHRAQNMSLAGHARGFRWPRGMALIDSLFGGWTILVFLFLYVPIALLFASEWFERARR